MSWNFAVLHFNFILSPVNLICPPSWDIPVAHSGRGRKRHHDGHMEVKFHIGNSIKISEGFTQVKAPPHLFFQGTTPYLVKGTDNMGGALICPWACLGSLLGLLSLSLPIANTLANSLWVSLHVRWLKLTHECIFPLSQINSALICALNALNSYYFRGKTME